METEALYEVLEQQYFGTNMQERLEIDQLPQILDNVSLFVDVGASLGQYTFFANKALKGARIVAIEADPFRYQHLTEAAASWEKLSSNQIRSFMPPQPMNQAKWNSTRLPKTPAVDCSFLTVETRGLAARPNGRKPKLIVSLSIVFLKTASLISSKWTSKEPSIEFCWAPEKF